MGSLHDLFSNGLANTGNNHIQRHIKTKTTAAIGLKTHLRSHFYIFIGNFITFITADMNNGIFKTGSISSSKQLFRIGSFPRSNPARKSF